MFGKKIVFTLLALGGTAFGAPDFQLSCKDTYGPKLDIRVMDQKIVFFLRDSVTANYVFVQSLFKAAGKPLPAIDVGTEFSVDTVIPTDPISLDLTLGASQFLPGFGKALISASSVYKEVQPVTPVDVTLIQGGQTVVSFSVKMTFAFLDTKIREVREEYATQATALTQDMTLDLTVFTSGKDQVRADLFREFSPFTCDAGK